nr:tyrosine-type recombinase/integrase [uncultured Niameybacter sp.]
MAETKLILQVLEPQSDFDNIMIGNSKFSDDVWDLRPFITAKNIDTSKSSIRFSYIDNDDFKKIVKQYAYYKLGQIKPLTVRDYINAKLPTFIDYCAINGIDSFVDITQEDFLNFSLWMKDERKVANKTGYASAKVVEEIIKIGQIKGWNVPQTNIFKGVSASQIWNTKKAKQSMKANKTKPIPEDVFDKILYHAVNDEKDILTKAGIIIQSQTGLRINEVLSIQKGCVKQFIDNGETYDYMEVTLGKTEKGEPIIHKVFINELVKNVIVDLTEATEPLRQESGLKELFITSRGNVFSRDNWNHFKLAKFMEKWNIRDNKGNLYPLTSHQFRATFVRELIKRKVPIAMIMKQYAHVSVEMTSHYLTLQEEEVKEIYTDMILSPESKIAGLRAKEIKGKLDDMFHGKTQEDIDQTIDSLSKSMSFNPLPTGVCLYDFRRGNCSDGDGCFFYNCPNYITEVKFYPILKDELVLLEKEMDRLKELGREREWQKQYIKYKSLKPLVDSLEVQLDDKKSIG